MNGTQIVNAAITSSSPELDDVKSKIAAVLDNMLTKIPAAKANGVSELDLRAMADTTIRKQIKKATEGKKHFIVEHDGKPAITGISQENVNRIVDMFNSQI